MDLAFYSACVIVAVLLSFVIFGHMPGYPSASTYYVSLIVSTAIVAVVFYPINRISRWWISCSANQSDVPPRTFQEAESEYKRLEYEDTKGASWRENFLFYLAFVGFLVLIMLLVGFARPTITYIFN